MPLSATQKDALGRTIAFRGHHPGDERVEGDDGDLADDLAEEPGPAHVPGRDERGPPQGRFVTLTGGNNWRAPDPADPVSSMGLGRCELPDLTLISVSKMA